MGQVVVEISLASAQISTKQSGVCGEESRHLETSHATQNKANACHPLVEMGDDILWLTAKLIQKLRIK